MNSGMSKIIMYIHAKIKLKKYMPELRVTINNIYKMVFALIVIR